MVKFQLNPKKLHKSYGYTWPRKGGETEGVTFDRNNQVHDIPAEAVPRLKELNQGANADIILFEEEAPAAPFVPPVKAAVKDWTKEQLAELAGKLEIPGYQGLSRRDLLTAVQDALPDKLPESTPKK
jgi:hypothetical protein